MVGNVKSVLFRLCDRCIFNISLPMLRVFVPLDDDVDGNDHTTFSVQYFLDDRSIYVVVLFRLTPQTCTSLGTFALYLLCSLLMVNWSVYRDKTHDTESQQQRIYLGVGCYCY